MPMQVLSGPSRPIRVSHCLPEASKLYCADLRSANSQQIPPTMGATYESLIDVSHSDFHKMPDLLPHRQSTALLEDALTRIP